MKERKKGENKKCLKIYLRTKTPFLLKKKM